MNKEEGFRLGPFRRRGRKVEEGSCAVPECGAKLQARVVIDSRVKRPYSGRRGAIRGTMVSGIVLGWNPVSRKFESLAGGRAVSFYMA